MSGQTANGQLAPDGQLPIVSAVFLAYNRKEALRETVARMTRESGYPEDRLEVIVIDNASTDGTAQMIREEFPHLTLIESASNLGAPAWNQGFAAARGDYVLILDDDAYLKPGGLERAVRAAQQEDAGLVSFTVVSSYDETYRFNDEYRTGLLSYWGCAALVSRQALAQLGGYDPKIFIWANELEFTMRLLSGRFAHLFLPDVVAVHMKPPDDPSVFKPLNLRNNSRHWGYVAGKLMRPSDAALTFAALAAQTLVEAIARDRRVIKGFRPVIEGFAEGLRNRNPVRPVVSRTYRKHFRTFDPPWRYWRSPTDRWRVLRAKETADIQRQRRQAAYFEQRRAFYPDGRASLKL